MQKTYKKIVAFLGSRTFFWLVIAFFVLEALWIAFSFRFPMLYDENFHFNVIKIFSHHALPFVSNQPHTYDVYGDLAHEGSTFYHYLMSFPYRFIELFTGNQVAQVVFLRIINIALASAGLLIFAKLFRKTGIKQAYINLAFLVFALLPIVPFVAATINYDNMLFLLTAIYLLVGVRLIQNPKVAWRDYVGLIVIGCFASLVKYSFLPIFAASLIYLAILIFKRHGKKFWPRLVKSFKTQRRGLALSTVALVVFVGLFSAVYIQNVVRYGVPNPSCTQTMSKQRCSVIYVVERDLQAKATKSQRPTMFISDYTQKWISNMLNSSTITGVNISKGTVAVASGLPIIYNLVFFVTIIGISVLLYAWKAIPKDAAWYFLLTMTIVLFAAVYAINVKGYYANHAAFANQSRYLLSVIPILVVMIAVAAGYCLRRLAWLKLTLLLVLLLLFTQGGGVINHIMRSDANWDWQNNTVIKANNKLRDTLRPVIKEKSGI